MGEGTDQRGYLREPLMEVEIRLQSGAEEFRLLEISLGGLAIASSTPFDPGQQLFLQFPPFENVGVEVRVCQPFQEGSPLKGWGHRIGARFLEPESGVHYYSHAMDIVVDTLEEMPEDALSDLQR